MCPSCGVKQAELGSAPWEMSRPALLHWFCPQGCTLCDVTCHLLCGLTKDPAVGTALSPTSIMGVIPAISLVVPQAWFSQDRQCRSLSVYALKSGVSATSGQVDARWELWKQPRRWPGPVSVCTHPLDAKARPFPAVRAPVVHGEVLGAQLTKQASVLKSANTQTSAQFSKSTRCGSALIPSPPLPVGTSLPLAFLKSPRGGPESAGSSLGQRLLGRPFPALRLCSRTMGFRGVTAPTLSTPNGCFQTLTLHSSDPDDGVSLAGGGPGFFLIHLPVAAILPSSPSECLQPSLLFSPGLPSRASAPRPRLHQWMQVSGWGAQGSGMDSQCKSGLPAED